MTPLTLKLVIFTLKTLGLLLLITFWLTFVRLPKWCDSNEDICFSLGEFIKAMSFVGMLAINVYIIWNIFNI